MSMMHTPGPARFKALKREARLLRGSVKRSLEECRDRIAYREGFKNWAQMEAAATAFAKATGAALFGLEHVGKEQSK